MPSDREPHSAVAALLAVTPTQISTGHVAHEYLVLPDFRTMIPGDCARFGPPEPVAARQAAAFLRWLVEKLRNADPFWGGSYDDDELAFMADEIEDQYRTEGDRP